MYYYQSLLAEDVEHMMASKAISMATATNTNLSSEVKSTPTSQAANSVKPCCVCKDEKASRDECMLFSNAKDPQKDCASTVERYRSCMAGFGFQLP